VENPAADETFAMFVLLSDRALIVTVLDTPSVVIVRFVPATSVNGELAIFAITLGWPATIILEKAVVVPPPPLELNVIVLDVPTVVIVIPEPATSVNPEFAMFANASGCPETEILENPT
jgi:hypothetical protein